MKLIEDIQKKIGQYILKRELLHFSRKKTLFNIEDAKTFAILYDSSDKENIDLVKKYVLYLKELRKKVKVVGYHSLKNIPEFTYSKLEYEYFSRNDLNWYLKPAGVFLDNFINEDFDVLIDLNITDQFPLEYIASLSKAKFKVGKYSLRKKDTFDMMIEMDKDKSFKFFLRQVDIYLSMINKKASI